MKDKLVELLKSDDISNHLLAYQLCKAVNIDLIDIVKVVFHDNTCWSIKANQSIIVCGINLFGFNFKLALAGNEVRAVMNNKSHFSKYKFNNEQEILDYLINQIEQYVNK